MLGHLVQTKNYAKSTILPPRSKVSVTSLLATFYLTVLASWRTTKVQLLKETEQLC